MWSDQKMNRLVKIIKGNAEGDRKEASDLLELCKQSIQELGTGLQEDAQGNLNVDTFTRLISAATQSLSQMGAANEKLLKLAQTMQKYQLKEMDLESKGGKAGSEHNRSMFNSLNALVREGKDA